MSGWGLLLHPTCVARFLGHLIEAFQILWAFAMLSYFTPENFNCNLEKFLSLLELPGRGSVPDRAL